MEQKETAMNIKINAQLSGGFLKGFLDFLDDERRPFELTIRRIKRGVWDLYLITTPEHERYFRSLLNRPEEWWK